MPKFEDRFVHFTWDESLKDRKCFVADNIPDLKSAFEHDYHEVVIGRSDEDFPFETETNLYRFAYYDPNFDVKKAYEQGEVIQYKAKDTGRWCDWDDSLSKCTFVDGVEYRIKSESERNAYVILNQTVGEPTLLWDFDKKIEKETRHIYFRGTLNECCDYIESHNKFAPIMKAWENGETIQFNNHDEWLDVTGDPEWIGDNDYRVKPEEPSLQWTDLKVGDIIQRNGITAMVTVIDTGDLNNMHIFAQKWIVDDELKEWRKYEALL